MDFLDSLKVFVGGFILLLVLLIPIIIPIAISQYFLDKKSCAETATKLNYSYDYSIWTGCIVTDTNNNRFLLEQLRQIKKD